MSSEAESDRIEELLADRAWLRAFALRLAGQSADADDLEQEALATVLRHPPRADRPLRPWLARVMANLQRRRIRARIRRQAREEVAFQPGPLPTPEELVERVATQQDVVAAVMELAEPYRATILLRFFEGCTARRSLHNKAFLRRPCASGSSAGSSGCANGFDRATRDLIT